jgi:hypothetical protein
MEAQAPLSGSRGEPHGVAVLAVEHALAGVRQSGMRRAAEIAHDPCLALVEVHPLAHQRGASTMRAGVAIGGEEPQAAPQQMALELLDVWDHEFMFAARVRPPAGGLQSTADGRRSRRARSGRLKAPTVCAIAPEGTPVDGGREHTGRQLTPQYCEGRYDRHRIPTGRVLRTKPT